MFKINSSSYYIEKFLTHLSNKTFKIISVSAEFGIEFNLSSEQEYIISH